VPFSLRLDPDTEAMIRRLTARTGRSKSDVVREAVARYGAEAESDDPGPRSTYERLKPYIGSVNTGGANFSEGTHEKFRAVLRRKHGARRSR
jgi:Arc/MetJ-type ribon-helix-helix transcriptional regulator